MSRAQVSFDSRANYAAATPVAHTVSITAATLTVTALDATMVYGVAPPAVTAGYSGFVNG